MKARIFFILAIAMTLLGGCNNFFHDLIPPPDNDIISFAVQFGNGARSATAAAIENQVVTVTVPDGTDLTNLIPVVSVSEKATVIPGTLPYLSKIFPDRDLLHMAVQMNNAFKDGTFRDWFLNIALETKNIQIPELTMPVDFTTPVYFCVISGDGNHKLYTVRVLTETEKIIEDTGVEPAGADNFILGFEVPGQKGTTTIIHEAAGGGQGGKVKFVMEQGKPVHGLLPSITVSDGARILPLTMSYIMNCGFTYDQMLGFYTGYSTAADTEKYVAAFLRRATNLVFPEIAQPLDFSGDVPFAVVGSDGGVRIYNASCTVDDGTPRLERVYFSKADNPNLLADVECEYDAAAGVWTGTVNDDYLVPRFSYIGDKITIGSDEAEFVDGRSYNFYYNGEIRVHRGGNVASYRVSLSVVSGDDGIVDWRFLKRLNPGIRADAIASVYDEGNTGFISVTVLYEGEEPPYELVPDFRLTGGGNLFYADDLGPRAPGATYPYSGDKIDFQHPRKFTWRNSSSRLYTVSVEFVQVIPAEAAIKSFTFPVHLNGDLSRDAAAYINDADSSIRCEVTYSGPEPPKALVPEFDATGAVSCGGSVQISGSTANDFTRGQYYTVTAGDAATGLVQKTYKVEVVFKQDAASSCKLLEFGFERGNNPSLDSDVAAVVTQRTGAVQAFMPFGTGATEGRPLVPTFRAEGTVTVDGAAQTSGSSSQDFSGPVTYTVTSANGLYTKEYTVALRERGAVIYVDSTAVGLGDGTSWEDAYTTLRMAQDAAFQAPEGSAQEIWVAGTSFFYDSLYVPKGTPQLGYLAVRGGFSGTETTPDERTGRYRPRLVINTIQGVESVLLDGFVLEKEYDSAYIYCDELVLNDCVFRTSYYSYHTYHHNFKIYSPTISMNRVRLMDGYYTDDIFTFKLFTPDDSRLTITDSEFTGDYGLWIEGGEISGLKASGLARCEVRCATLEDSSFEDVGGLSIYPEVMRNCTVKRCVPNGGGFLSRRRADGTWAINYNSIVYCSSDNFSSASASVTLEGCVFEDNLTEIPLGYDPGGYDAIVGGCVGVSAFSLDEPATLTLRNCSFSTSSAPSSADYRGYFVFGTGYSDSNSYSTKVVLEGVNTVRTNSSVSPFYLDSVGVVGSWQWQ